eukprot:Rhum_TRINITY_DN10612_c0_g1::Rhum_TRINITY_DN10612_c0_g1_i1::g.39291::m.39291
MLEDEIIVLFAVVTFFRGLLRAFPLCHTSRTAIEHVALVATHSLPTGRQRVVQHRRFRSVLPHKGGEQIGLPPLVLQQRVQHRRKLGRVVRLVEALKPVVQHGVHTRQRERRRRRLGRRRRAGKRTTHHQRLLLLLLRLVVRRKREVIHADAGSRLVRLPLARHLCGPLAQVAHPLGVQVLLAPQLRVELLDVVCEPEVERGADARRVCLLQLQQRPRALDLRHAVVQHRPQLLRRRRHAVAAARKLLRAAPQRRRHRVRAGQGGDVQLLQRHGAGPRQEARRRRRRRCFRVLHRVCGRRHRRRRRRRRWRRRRCGSGGGGSG